MGVRFFRVRAMFLAAFPTNLNQQDINVMPEEQVKSQNGGSLDYIQHQEVPSASYSGAMGRCYRWLMTLVAEGYGLALEFIFF